MRFHSMEKTLADVSIIDQIGKNLGEFSFGHLLALLPLPLS